MLKKVLLQTQFGDPHPWTEQYFANFKTLESYGWYLKVFTPNPWKSEANIEIIPMTIEQFDALIEKYCGVNPLNCIVHGRPNKLVSDFYPSYGLIFQDYIRDFDFWWHSNWDVCYGRLDRFIPDSELEKFDIWSNDPDAINGIFCLYRNHEGINNLFRNVPNWQQSFTTQEPTAFDEHQMSRTVRDFAAAGKIRFGFPRYFAYESYDRLPQHQPTPNIYLESDGGLIEFFKDSLAKPPGSARPGIFGHEIMMFHFRHSKQWPLAR